MKNCLFILLLFSSICFSCGQNRMKIDEKKMSVQIADAENDKAEKALQEVAARDTIRYTPGVRYDENRNPQEGNLPVVIDVVGARQTPETIKLSRFFNHIEYVFLEQDPDSLLFKEAKYGGQFIIAPKYIYVYSWGAGIMQYDKQGHFVQYVVKNQAEYNRYEGGARITSEQAQSFIGAKDAYMSGGKIYYTYHDCPARKVYLVEYDDNESDNSVMLEISSVEKERTVRGKGEIIGELDSDVFGFFRQKIPYVVAPGLIAHPQRGKSTQKEDFIAIVSPVGDTICSFRDYDPVENYSKSVYRNSDGGDRYFLDGILHLRQPYNDTIYKLIPPNTIVPLYVIDYGGRGITKSIDGIDPGFDMSDKLIHIDWLESDKHIFFTYSKGYPDQQSAKNGTLKYNRLIFDKQTGKTRFVYIDAEPFMAGNWPTSPDINVENDIDGVYFRWPKNLTEDGKPYTVLSTKEILKSDTANFPYKKLSENDFIIAIYH